MKTLWYSSLLVLLYLTDCVNSAYVYYPDVDLYYKFHREPLKWYDAKQKCIEEHATLALPLNKTEADIIAMIFNGYKNNMLSGVVHPDFVLLGFHDMFEESEFVSLNGDPLQYYFHKWSGGQPDNANNEDCGSMHRNGLLNDFPCGIPSTFICQKDGVNIKLPPINNKCMSNDMAYQYAEGINKCYKVHMNPKKWTDARAMCNLEGGHLAIIRSKAEEVFLTKMFNDPDNKVHYAVHSDYGLLGFHDLYKEGFFTTVLDEDLHGVGYINWAPGQPDNGARENCGSMHKSGGLNDFPCNTPAVFICEQPAISLDLRVLQ